MGNLYKWTDFYQELADKVLAHKSNRSLFIKKVEEAYKEAGQEYKFYWDGHYFTDMDPFTFFGSFNKGIKDERRIELAKAYKKVFEMEAEIPTEFAGVPVLSAMQAWFMDDRQGEQMETYWNLLEVAISYADGNEGTEGRLADLFDKAVGYNGTSWNMTMGLFWIRPFCYVNLDNTNRPKLRELGCFDGKFPTGKQYLGLSKELKEKMNEGTFPYKSFPELSSNSYNFRNEKKTEEKMCGNSAGDAFSDGDVVRVHYWIYSPGDGAAYWDEFYKKGIMGIGWDEIGDLRAYGSKDEMKEAMKAMIDPSKPYKNAAHATWQFTHEMQVGDVVFAKKGMHVIVGRGVVESDYEYDPSRKEYRNVRKVKWTHNGEWPHPGQAVMKTLTNISAYTNYVEQLNSLFESEVEDDVEEQPEVKLDPYTSAMFLDEVFMEEEKYNELVALVKKKKNVILQGAPGVGKTFAAKRLAYSMMGVMDRSRVMMVQFHQSYSYEDFIMGFRPTQQGGFEIKHGAFYDFCKSAEVDDKDKPYFFIIDEINRGNLSKIFGELFMLIESDKRGYELRLLYEDEQFSVPENVYIIGMMNTADRSLAMMDYALRRRFAFFDIEPGFSSKGFKKYRSKLANEKFDRLIGCVEDLNKAIVDDDSLGEGFRIGHSYFCNLGEDVDAELPGVVEYELIPLLKEYWFDEQAKVKTWTDALRSAIK